jgi:hypothetical protein
MSGISGVREGRNRCIRSKIGIGQATRLVCIAGAGPLD